jgi:hypothetical protein
VRTRFCLATANVDLTSSGHNRVYVCGAPVLMSFTSSPEALRLIPEPTVLDERYLEVLGVRRVP